MPWRPLPRMAFGIATYPFSASSPADLPLEIGDELYIIEEGGQDASWFRGYLVAPPSLLAGLTSVKGQTLEARVFSGIFPRCCVEVREVLGDTELDGSAHGLQINGDSPRLEQWDEDSTGHTRRSSRRVDGTWRDISGTSATATLSVADGSNANGVNTGTRPSRSPSQKARNHLNGHVISRKVSHRSITGSQRRSSPVSLAPAPNSTFRDPQTKRPQAPVPMLKIGDESPTSNSEPLVDEIASALREWHSKDLHEMLLARRYSTLDKISELVTRLDLARKQLLHGVLTSQELQTLREDVIWNLVDGNKMLSNEVIVRDSKQRGRLLTGDDSAIEMTRLQSMMSLLDRPPVFQYDSIDAYHLMVDVKAFANTGLVSPTLTMYLCFRIPGEPLKPFTESFVIDLAPPEGFEQLASLGAFRTLFTDLTANEIGDKSRPGSELCLVVKIQASQAIQVSVLKSPLKEKVFAENRPLSRPGTSTNSSTTSTKGGRQSIMWAQKQFGSVRSRTQGSTGSTLAPATVTASAAPAEKGLKPTPQDTSRPTSQKGPQYVKKNIGVGVMNVKHIIGRDASEDQDMSIWAPAAASSATQSSMEDWNGLISDLISSESGVYTKTKAVNHLRLNLQSFTGSNADDIVSKTPTLLQHVIQTPRTTFPAAPTKQRSDIYVKVCNAFLPHQALLSHPDKGSLQLSSSLTLRNVQLTLEVRKKTGERIEHCIFPGSNISGQTAWRTSAVERGEAWDQMIKLVIPTEEVPEAHLITSIADAPGFPFALSWMPLWVDGAFVSDGAHAPLLYAYDQTTSGSNKGRGAYLAFPWDSRGRDGDLKDETLTGPIATLMIETQLCSSHFSQDAILLGILRWREKQGDQILDLLERISFVPECEIVKLIGDIFDSLFGILVENAGKDAYENAVFNGLVLVLGIVHDRRFNLGPYVDSYTETRFDHPFAAPCLIRSYLRLLANPSDPDKSRRVRATFKVGRQILRFIICARKSQELKEAGIGANTQSTFKHDLRTLFHAFQNMIKDPSPVLVGTKTLIVQHMHSWLPELKGAFSDRELLDATASFLESCSEVQGKLVLYKLVLILNLSDSDVFSQSEVRQQLFKMTAKWIDPHWGLGNGSAQWRDQVRLCCSIVSKQTDESQMDVTNYLYKAIQSYRSLLAPGEKSKENVSLLFPSAYPFATRPLSTPVAFDEALTELGALLATLGRLHTPKRGEGSSPERTDMLYDGLDVITSLISGTAFPTFWLSLYVFHHKTWIQMLETIFEWMIVDYIPNPEEADNFNTELWSKYFSTLLTLVRSDTLALETFPEQKRRAVWKIAGDVREQGAVLLKRSWEALGWDASMEENERYGLLRLGGYQVQYVPSLVPPIVELCLSVHEGLRNVAVRILQAMIISEWTLNEDLSVIQAEMVDCLEMLFQSKNMGESLVQKMFVSELLDLFQPLDTPSDDLMWQAIRGMISTIDELLEMLAAVHSPDITENLRIMNTLQLMSFLKDMQKEDIFIRYVHQLALVQAKLDHKTEAGLALRLHADLYTWENIRVRFLVEPPFPEQSSFERKEKLYFEMIKYFEDGEAWETALTSYRELAEQYEHAHFDLAKLARTQRAMATIYDTITRGEWLSPRYFRVVYHGLGFPSSLRGKKFIYEAGASERQSGFTDRMRQLHPAAQVVTRNDFEDDQGQHLQIFPVSVYRDLEHPIYQQSRVLQPTRDFISASKPYRFAITSKRHSPSSGVQAQYIEKTIFSTKETFPTILRRSEIISVDELRLSPLQTAVERTTRKTSELAALERKIEIGDESAIQSLTEAIQSSVDPASVATVAQYRQLLPQASEQREEDAEEVLLSPLENALEIALLDHVSMLKHCMSHYMRPDHVHSRAFLTQNMQETFAPELAVLAPDVPPLQQQQIAYISPPSSLVGLSSTPAPKLTLTNGNIDGDTLLTPQLPPPESQSRQQSRLNLGFLKTSGPNTPKMISTTPAPSDDGSSSGRNLSHGGSSDQGGFSNGSHRSASANTTAPLPPPSDDAASERPMTAQSGKSSSTGRLKKRLSSLGIGRVTSSKEKIRGEMGDVAEE